MLSTEEIKKLTDYQLVVFKEVFATKNDLKVLEHKVDKVQTSLDAVLKEKVTSTLERTVANRRIKELEN
ncbi:MAG: hypothetical protein P4L74_05755 [Candidatus Doudnabacteria bacterium]|nr:hypothetical protein [Candidatus Doudnabacteria bacterium]